ncbi:hypothetical protein ABZ793_33075 [Micromonospora sp. NPDC047465]|uniref:hypothetical protein n=1 Tax=Micromonospora sp. NPDC047465 TaxID=3154813 RepID=UPI0033E2A74F
MTVSEWSRRYDADQRVPYLPTDDRDLDEAVTELRVAVGEIDPNGSMRTVSSVLRVLRQRRGLAAQVLDKHEPTCLSCGGTKQCVGCDDIRPVAETLDQGWRFLSPAGRWETVERAERENEYAPVRVWTDKTGSGYSWSIPPWRKVEAVPPVRWHGVPEIRIWEYDYARDAPMYAVVTLDTVYRPDTDHAVVEGRYSREDGWRVIHRPDGGEVVVIDCGRSKDKARSALRAAARQHAKALGVQVTVQPRRRLPQPPPVPTPVAAR